MHHFLTYFFFFSPQHKITKEVDRAHRCDEQRYNSAQHNVPTMHKYGATAIHVMCTFYDIYLLIYLNNDFWFFIVHTCARWGQTGRSWADKPIGAASGDTLRQAPLL